MSVVIMREMSADEEMREIARLKEKTILDERSAMNFARKEGRQEGRKEGRQETIAELLVKMRQKGYTEEQIRDILE